MRPWPSSAQALQRRYPRLVIFDHGPHYVAFEVEGDSMLPACEAGTIIACLRDQVRSTGHYLGHRAAVRTVDGTRLAI